MPTSIGRRVYKLQLESTNPSDIVNYPEMRETSQRDGRGASESEVGDGSMRG